MQLNELSRRRVLLTSLSLLVFLFPVAGRASCEEGERYLDLARKSGAQQDFAQATLWLQRSTKACDSYDAWHLMGTALRQQRRIEEALEAYTRPLNLRQTRIAPRSLRPVTGRFWP